jgi:RNA-directed DNA polymerase
MDKKRRKIQLELPFPVVDRGEASKGPGRGIEVSMALPLMERPADEDNLMEAVVERGNLLKALRRVMTNKGGPGIDGMTVLELPDFLRKNWLLIREQLLKGTYRPKPVKRKETPKKGGGVRKLGIPCVSDRLIQQMLSQVLQKDWDPTFSKHSYGFMLGRSCHQAILAAQDFIIQGYQWVVDIDLEKFFDRVNHDQLMARVAKRTNDRRGLKLIRSFLNSGVMENGLVSAQDEGTPQGGPLSPLLSNLVLDDLDKELEKRGHHFCRYADDCNIYVKSKRAGRRVMQSISGFISRKLKLKVNESKSAVARPTRRKFLGITITAGKTPKRQISSQAKKEFKDRVRQITLSGRGKSLRQNIEELKVYFRGWIGYFGFCQTPTTFLDLNKWVRRRLRATIWRHLKRPRARIRELMKRGVTRLLAIQTGLSSKGAWRISTSPPMHIAFPSEYFVSLGLPELGVRKSA